MPLMEEGEGWKATAGSAAGDGGREMGVRVETTRARRRSEGGHRKRGGERNREQRRKGPDWPGCGRLTRRDGGREKKGGSRSRTRRGQQPRTVLPGSHRRRHPSHENGREQRGRSTSSFVHDHRCPTLLSSVASLEGRSMTYAGPRAPQRRRQLVSRPFHSSLHHFESNKLIGRVCDEGQRPH